MKLGGYSLVALLLLMLAGLHSWLKNGQDMGVYGIFRQHGSLRYGNWWAWPGGPSAQDEGHCCSICFTIEWKSENNHILPPISRPVPAMHRPGLCSPETWWTWPDRPSALDISRITSIATKWLTLDQSKNNQIATPISSHLTYNSCYIASHKTIP